MQGNELLTVVANKFVVHQKQIDADKSEINKHKQ